MASETFARGRARTDLSLADFFSEIWRGRFYIFSGLLFGFLIALALVALAVPHGGAQMTIAPATPIELAAASLQARDFSSGLAAQNGAGAQHNFEQFQTVAGGASAASLLLRSEEITRGLSRDQAFSFVTPERAWSAAKLADYIGRRVVFEPVGETAQRRMRYMHPDPEFAALFLQRIHAIADGLIRYNTRREVNGRIDYLRAELEKARNPEHRRALADLLMEQERLRMLVSIDQPYAAAVVEPAFVSAAMRWPDAALTFPVFACAGALAGFAIFSLRWSFAAQAQAQAEAAMRETRPRGARRPGLSRAVEQNNEGEGGQPRRSGFSPDAAE